MVIYSIPRHENNDIALPPPYEAPPPTNEDLDFADLAIIDLSKCDTLQGRLQLAAQVSQAMKTHGFFYAINHGYTLEQTNQIFSIANLTFDNVTEDEKSRYTGDSLTVYEGYKPQQTWLIDGGVQDRIEHYNINRHLHRRPHPIPLRPFLPLIEIFARHNHFNILLPILRLLALGLELPEDALVEKHNYDSPGHTSGTDSPTRAKKMHADISLKVRFMKYFTRSEEEERNSKNVWLKGHTDIGSVTILWSQPIGGLQILSLDGKWRWVRHIENALVVNAGDVLEFLCGKYYPATRHRVAQPPADQRNVPRLGVFYFSMPDDEVKLVPFEDSPVLQKVGIIRLCDPEVAPTMKEWRQARTASYGKVALKPSGEKNVEEEVVNGVVVKHYN